ncbi:hypothetical protein ES703_62728 [subsurface metagenome]
MNRDTRMDAVEGVMPLAGGSTPLDGLTKSGYGPFLLLFCLFIVGFVMCTGGILLIVLGGRVAVSLFMLFMIVAGLAAAREKWASKSHTRGSRGGILNEPEKWVIVLGLWLPGKHREAILGDILEDCHEMRDRGFRERKIRSHVLWQWAIAVVKLIPASVIGAIGRLWSAR